MSSGWVHMSCCGAVWGGPHEFGCEDARLEEESAEWPSEEAEAEAYREHQAEIAADVLHTRAEAEMA